MERSESGREGLERRVGKELFPAYSGGRRMCDTQLFSQGYTQLQVRHSDRPEDGVRHRASQHHLANHREAARYWSLRGKSMVDMGTGTGILAILAAMRGASPVAAIEIDPFAYTNAVENVKLNSHPEIVMIEGDASKLNGIGFKADVFVANINRNVITGDMERYVAAVANGGTMLLSGFYVEDIPIVREAGEVCGMRYADYTEHKNWACVRMVKG